MIFCISSGGALIKYAKKHKVPYLQVPSGMPPRAALPYMLVPLLFFLEKAGLVTGVKEELEETTILLEKISEENGPETLTRDNFAKTTATHIGDTAPVVYGSGFSAALPIELSSSLTKTANQRLNGVFPELDHNEIVGWEAGEQCRYFS